MDYSMLRRTEYTASTLDKLPRFDLFVSAFNKSQRVNQLYHAVRANSKAWLVHPEYNFSSMDLPDVDGVHVLSHRDEAEFWIQYLETGELDGLDADASICIDITGFMRPHLMLFPRLLALRGYSRLDVLYSDPVTYSSGEKTQFTQGAVTEVRQVRGFEGTHTADAGEEDLLIIGAGYDYELIRRVAESKRAARKLEMFGLPSLRPHMYEENRLRAALAEESVGPLPHRSLLFAPANDPFATAQELHDRIAAEERQGFRNLYLSPLATKAQTLGFALYYLRECMGSPASMLFPFAEYYSIETAKGLARVSRYELELDWLVAS